MPAGFADGVDDTGDGDAWSLNGNAGTDPSTHYLGTNDGITLTLAVSGTPALRLEPSEETPNLIGGSETNTVAVGVAGVVIGGGRDNAASGEWATIGGGQQNRASNWWATVGGGYDNVASGSEATVGGGEDNTASGTGATVGGGNYNTTSNNYATIGGGIDNEASGHGATVGGGSSNTASGYNATVSGGTYNTARGTYSFAAGRGAQANNRGCFVWADSTSADVTCNDDDRWVARASGGVYFYTSGDLSTGVYVGASGGSWSSLSDWAVKENLAGVAPQEVLERAVAIPVSTWNYVGEAAGIRHMGPMAQDFYAAFGLGDSERHINSLDADGVALAAIQGLYAQNQALQQQVSDLEARLSALEASTSPNPSIQAGSVVLPGAGVFLIGGLGLWLLRLREGGR